MSRMFYLTALVWLACAGSAMAQQTPANDALSTELMGLDTLDVVPSEITTPYQGGTRRVQLDNTAFRREAPVDYVTEGRRDPFRALIVDSKRDGEIKTDLLIVDGSVLTGIVWADGGQAMAMVRAKDGRSFFLREGDPVYSGRVTSITQSTISFSISDFGENRQVTLKVNV